MGKSTVWTSNTSDQSQVNGLAAVRGDGNTVSIMDGDAIKESYAYAAKVNDSNSNNLAGLFSVVDSVAGKAIAANTESSSKTIAALQQGLSLSASGIQTAYAASQNGGIDPKTGLMILGAVLAVAFIFRG